MRNRGKRPLVRNSQTMSSEPLLSITRLQKTVNRRMVLDIDRFELSATRGVMLRGPNGAGKTMLLKIIAGLLPPDHAEIQIDCHAGDWREVVSQLRSSIVYLHQQPYLFDRSVAANIAYGLRRRGMSRLDTARLVTDSLEWAGLAHLSERNARQLSGGEKQRVALTRARVLSPKILLLDEPLSGMDRDARQRTTELLQSLRAAGAGLVITSHELDSSDASWDAEFELNDGRLTILRDAPLAAV